MVCDSAIDVLCEALGVSFSDVKLLELAVTHSSAAAEDRGRRGAKHRAPRDNERLEFLGDAVLGLVVGEALWRALPEAPEGELSRVRAAVVNERNLATVAAELGLGEALRLGRGEEQTGGRGKASILCDAFEAVVAAVYLDAGLETARAMIGRLLAASIDDAVRHGEVHIDEKTVLQERLQGERGITPRYEVVGAEGPDHARQWTVVMIAGDFLRTEGVGASKKTAERAAAREALGRLDALTRGEV